MVDVLRTLFLASAAIFLLVLAAGMTLNAVRTEGDDADPLVVLVWPVAFALVLGPRTAGMEWSREIAHAGASWQGPAASAAVGVCIFEVVYRLSRAGRVGRRLVVLLVAAAGLLFADGALLAEGWEAPATAGVLMGFVAGSGLYALVRWR